MSKVLHIKLTCRLQLIYNMEINFKWGYNSCSKFDAVENETITTTFKYHVWKKFISVRIVLCLSYRMLENKLDTKRLCRVLNFDSKQKRLYNPMFLLWNANRYQKVLE